MRLTCGQCGRAYNGSDAGGGHCTDCHQSFQSNAAFDRHRTGPFDGPLLIRRRCRTPAEMLAHGWRRTPRDGYWTPFPPRPGPWRDREPPKPALGGPGRPLGAIETAGEG